MHTVICTNNAYDTILLVDDSDKVVSRWDVEPSTLRDYLVDSADAGDWHEGQWPSGFAPEDADTEEQAAELQTIACYGREYGRDGVIEDEERAEFWGVPTQMAFRAIYKAGHRDQGCIAIGVTSTSKALLRSALTDKGISLADVEIVPVEEEAGE